MSEKKRTILAIYLLVLVAACMYVPWEAGTADSTMRIPAGYAVIWEPPAYYAWNSSTAKTIGEKPNELDIIWKTQGQPGNTVFEKYMASQSANNIRRLPITGIDMKRLGIEILGLTVICGMAFFLMDWKEKKASK